MLGGVGLYASALLGFIGLGRTSWPKLSGYVASWPAFTPQGYMANARATQLLPWHCLALTVSLASQLMYLLLRVSKSFAL